MKPSSIEHDPTPARNDYETRAEAVAQRLAGQWQAAGSEDVKSLSDAVYQALVDEANLELRQVLASVRGQLELAKLRAARGQPAMTPERMTDMMAGLDRASSLMDVFLDRASATKLIIRLDRRPFSLTEALERYIDQQDLAPRVRLTSLPSWVEADERKLLDAIGHLVIRLYHSARSHEIVVLAVAQQGKRVEGFVGLSPSHLAPEELMNEIHLPLRVEDVGIDIAYTRAVIERHGGTLFVATAEDSSVGFGFTLPGYEEAGE